MHAFKYYAMQHLSPGGGTHTFLCISMHLFGGVWWNQECRGLTVMHGVLWLVELMCCRCRSSYVALLVKLWRPSCRHIRVT